jgi:hypothetical protein
MLTEIRVQNIANAGPKLSIGRWSKSAGVLAVVALAVILCP